MGEPAGAGARAWYVQAAGRVWGPYPEARLESFVAEGRIAAGTLIAPTADGPFHPAARQARLHRLFGDDEPEGGEPAEEPRAQRPVEAAATAGPVRPLLVWAQVQGRRAERFEQRLAIHGPFVRIGEALWLVRAREGAAALRNALTRRLEAVDGLMVVEAPLDRAAWFNLDGETDRTLRQLWTNGER